MRKVNRLGWTAGMSFQAFGTRFGIRTNDADILADLPAYLPLGWQPDQAEVVDMLYSLRVGGESRRKGRRNYHLLYYGAGRLARTFELEEVFDALERHVRLMMAFMAKGYLFIHAGVVGWRGQAIVLPGRTFTGKTTLVTALVKAGATYYSDEFTILDPEGRVHPYPLPLSIRDVQGQNAQKIPIERLGGQVGTETLPVGLVVVTTYQPEAKWQPKPLSPGRTAATLLDNTVSAQINQNFSLPILAKAVIGAQCIKSKRGEAHEIVAELLERVAS